MQPQGDPVDPERFSGGFQQRSENQHQRS